MKESDTDKAPDKIVEMLSKDYEKIKFDILDVETSQDLIENQKNIEEAVPSRFFVGIGGDHSITYSLINGTKKKPLLVMMDAHPDCEIGFDNVTHEDFVRKLVENQIVSGVVFIGLRKWSNDEMNFIKKNNLVFFSSYEIMQKGIKRVTEDLMSLLRGKKFYLSIDIDGVDPGFAPGVDWPEPGGITSRELLYFIGKIKKMDGLIGADLVEINPEKDVNNITVKLGSEIIKALTKH